MFVRAEIFFWIVSVSFFSSGDFLPDSFRTLPEPRPKTPNLQGFRIASGRFRMAWGLSRDLKNFMWRAPRKIKERRKTQRETSRLQQNPRKFIAQGCMKLSNQLRRKPFPACFPQNQGQSQGQGHTSCCNGVLQHVVWARLGLAWRGSGVAKASSGAAGASSARPCVAPVKLGCSFSSFQMASGSLPEKHISFSCASC